MCALKQLISPVNMFFYSDVRIWLEDAAIATASLFANKKRGQTVKSDLFDLCGKITSFPRYYRA